MRQDLPRDLAPQVWVDDVAGDAPDVLVVMVLRSSITCARCWRISIVNSGVFNAAKPKIRAGTPLLTIRIPPFFRSRRFVLSAAGSHRHQHVWRVTRRRRGPPRNGSGNPRRRSVVPAGARISAGKSGKVARSLRAKRCGERELVAGDPHAVARVAHEADDRGTHYLLRGSRGVGTIWEEAMLLKLAEKVHRSG